MPTLLQRAIELAKARQREDAEKLLRQILEVNPDNEVAWMWLSGVVRDPAEKKYALERALSLNPQNPLARQGIDRFEAQLPPEQRGTDQPTSIAPDDTSVEDIPANIDEPEADSFAEDYVDSPYEAETGDYGNLWGFVTSENEPLPGDAWGPDPEPESEASEAAPPAETPSPLGCDPTADAPPAEDFQFDFVFESQDNVFEPEEEAPAADDGFSFAFGSNEPAPDDPFRDDAVDADDDIPTVSLEDRLNFGFDSQEPDDTTIDPEAEAVEEDTSAEFDWGDTLEEDQQAAVTESRDDAAFNFDELFNLQAGDLQVEAEAEPDVETFQLGEDEAIEEDIDEPEPEPELTPEQLRARALRRKRQQERLLIFGVGLMTVFTIVICGLYAYVNSAGLYVIVPDLAPPAISREFSGTGVKNINLRGYPAGQLDLTWIRNTDADTCDGGEQETGLEVTLQADADPITLRNQFLCRGNQCSYSRELDGAPLLNVNLSQRCAQDVGITVSLGQTIPQE